VPTVTLAICIRGAGRAFVKFWEGKLLEVHWGNCRPSEISLSIPRSWMPKMATNLVYSKCGARNSETYNRSSRFGTRCAY